MMTLRRDDPPEISSTKTIPAKTTPAKTTPAGGVPTARVRPLVVTRGILWSFRLLHLAPLVALYLLPVGKWPAVIIAALWPLWLIGLFFLEMQLLHRWLGLGLSRAGRAFLRDAEAADYYRHAAARGHPRAQGRLGEMYRTGNAVPRNRGPPICGCPARWPAWRQRLTGQTGPPRGAPDAVKIQSVKKCWRITTPLPLRWQRWKRP